MSPRRVINDDRHVVRPHRAVETYFLVSPHRSKHISLAVVVEGLLKVCHGPADISEVYLEDLLPGPKVPYCFHHIFTHL